MQGHRGRAFLASTMAPGGKELGMWKEEQENWRSVNTVMGRVLGDPAGTYRSPET